MPDTSAILKYLKVKALAEQGAPGERDNAARILAKMERDHPGIKQAAAAFRKADEQPEEPAPSPGPGGAAGAGNAWSRKGNWEEIFNFARGFASEVADFANTVANAYAGRQLVEDEVELYSRSTKAGNVLLSFRMSLSAFNRARRLNGLQRGAFRKALHEMLDEELDELIGIEDY